MKIGYSTILSKLDLILLLKESGIEMRNLRKENQKLRNRIGKISSQKYQNHKRVIESRNLWKKKYGELKNDYLELKFLK